MLRSEARVPLNDSSSPELLIIPPPQVLPAKKVAIWIDGPNFAMTCQQNGVEMPIAKMLAKIQQALGEIVFAAVFHNRSSSATLKIFKTFDITNIICTSVKDEFVRGYDPVDEDIDRTVRKLVDIADIHVIVSADRDFHPLISWLRLHRGKEGIRLYVERGKNRAVLALPKEPIYIDCSVRGENQVTKRQRRR